MSPRGLPLSGARKTRRLATAAATAAVALTVAGMSTAPAQSAPDADCPAAYPLGSVTPDLPVHGLTVSQGTTPDPFTGTTLGVLHDGIAPGLDMILVRLTSPEVDRAGIWQGMSGSPVYAADGRLLGAVAYALAAGTTPVAGVTPAADMQKLLSGGGAGGGTLRSDVAIPPRLAQRIVGSGAASSTDVAGGMSQLVLPFGISGMANATRLHQFSKALGLRNTRPMAAGAVGAQGPVIPVVPGGNVAASISYGDVTTAGLGTATAVCGNEVLAFGHPMNFSGRSTMTMHGADAIYVQEDPTYASFKVANLGAPGGTITDDRRAGLRGLVGPAPATSGVTSLVTVDGSSRTGTTRVSVPDAVPDIAIAHVVGDQDRVLDSIGGGSSRFVWTIHLRRQDGTRLTVHRSDAFADQSDISYATVFDLANALYTIQYVGLDKVTIDSVDTTSTMSHDYAQYTLGAVQLRRHGSWRTLHRNGNLRLVAGSTARFRVHLHSRELGPLVVRTSVPVPVHAGNKGGVLQVFGGNTGGFGGGGDVFAEGSDSASSNPTGSLTDLLKQITSAPHHDQVVTDVTWVDRAGAQTNHKQSRVSAGHVVDGSFSMSVTGVRRR